MTSTTPLQHNVLHSTLDSDLISINKSISSAKKLLEEMARLLTSALDDEVREKDIYHQLLEREKLGNTGVGNGVALPHSRCEYATTAVVAIITLEQPIDYDSIDKQGVDLAFGLLLADIAGLMSDANKKRKLCGSKSPQEIISLIGSWSING